MTRFEYIAALRNALQGLPPEVVERTVAEYEKRIYEASAAGQNEDEIIAGLGDPQQVAAELHAQYAPKVPAVVAAAPQGQIPGQQTMPPSQRPGSVMRMFFSFIGLMVFNLFLVIPAIAYAGLLIGAFAVSLACYLGGVAVTGASVAGVNQISLAEPFHHVYFDKPGMIEDRRHHDGRTVVNIGEAGVHVETGDKRIHVVPASVSTSTETAAASAPVTASASADGDHNTTVDIGPKGIIVKDDSAKDDKLVMDDDEDVDVDMPGLHIHNRDIDMDHETVSLGTDFISPSQPVQVGVGIGIIFAGIVGFLLCLTIARLTWLAVVKLAQYEVGVLRGA